MLRHNLMVLTAFTGACAAPGSVAPEYTIARASTVQVQTQDGSGSGVVINRQCILTAAHVATTEVEVITTDSGHTTLGVLKAKDTAVDVAVVCAPEPLDAPPVTFAASMPQNYAPVFTIGYPLNFSKILTHGEYQGGNNISALSAPGNSGGGVFDSQARYVGLVDSVAAYNTPEGVFVFPHLAQIVALPAIEKFLDSSGIQYTKGKGYVS